MKKIIPFAIFLILLILFPLVFRNPFPRHLMIMIMMYAAMGIGWNIIGGYAGQVSFGNAAFFGVGAYASSVLLTKFGINPWLGMCAGCGFSVILAIIVGYPCFRLGGHYFAIATIAIGRSCWVSLWSGILWAPPSGHPARVTETPSGTRYARRNA